MKNKIKSIFFAVGLGLLIVACNSSDLPGYKKTENGLYYKFEKENKTAPQVKIGDVLIAETEIKLNDSILHSNIGKPDRMFLVGKSLFPGDLNEGLLMMHVGDEATFAISADSMAKYTPMSIPFEKRKKVKIYFSVKLSSIIDKESYNKEATDREKANMLAKNSEKDSIAGYVEKHKIKAAPTETGLYIVFVKKGPGEKAGQGKKVKVNYIGRFLTGKIFDTTIEQVAKAENIYNEERPYGPIEYVIGDRPFIDGWEETISLMKAGDIVEVIIPSSMAYGEHGVQGERGIAPIIEPYTPLFFRLELVAVE